jgi:NagD protein
MERRIESWLMDMDGVLVREEDPVPGADRFIAALRERGTPFLVRTNNSMYTRRDLAARLAVSGLVPESAFLLKGAIEDVVDASKRDR